MRVPGQTTTWTIRTAAVLVPLFGVILATGQGQQPAPVAPSVPAPAVTSVHGHLRAARVQLHPQPLPLRAVPTAALGAMAVVKNGNDEPEEWPELSLGDCIRIALENQPTLKALQASQLATVRGYETLMKFGTISTIVSPDVEVRKQQAKRGLMATSAESQKLHNEIVQDVTRLYFSAVMARQLSQLTDMVVLRLDYLVKIGEQILKDGDPKLLEGFNTLKLKMMQIGLVEAKKLQATAKLGRQRAKAALREVMGVDGRQFEFRLKDDALPIMRQNVPLTKEVVIGLALERRPELVLAAAGVDAFRLEVYAQARVPFKRAVPTFAFGKDIHATEIPTTIRTMTDYRPGGIIPEMPPQLVGTKYDRVQRAMAFAQRADALYEKTRNLIMLEAETTFYDFVLAGEKLRLAHDSNELSKQLQKQVRDAQDTVKAKDQLVQAEIIAAKTQAEYLDAVYQYLLALAALERVTAGGIRPDFPGR